MCGCVKNHLYSPEVSVCQGRSLESVICAAFSRLLWDRSQVTWACKILLMALFVKAHLRTAWGSAEEWRQRIKVGELALMFQPWFVSLKSFGCSGCCGMTVVFKLGMPLLVLFETEKSMGWGHLVSSEFLPQTESFHLVLLSSNWKKKWKFFPPKGKMGRIKSLIHIWLPFTSHYDLS